MHVTWLCRFDEGIADRHLCQEIQVDRQAIRDSSNKLLGYIETLGDGRQKATDASNKVLGYFDPVRNATTDPVHRVLARANILSGLIYDRR